MERNFHDFHRGEVYYADLDPVTGHEQGGIRPVLVIQNDTGNYHSPTIIVIAVTRRTFKKPKQPTHVVLDDAQGLAPSLFMSEVVRTIDKRRRSPSRHQTGDTHGNNQAHGDSGSRRCKGRAVSAPPACRRTEKAKRQYKAGT